MFLPSIPEEFFRWRRRFSLKKNKKIYIYSVFIRTVLRYVELALSVNFYRLCQRVVPNINSFVNASVLSILSRRLRRRVYFLVLWHTCTREYRPLSEKLSGSFSRSESFIHGVPNCVAISFRISLTSQPIDCSQCNRWIDQIANYDFWNIAALQGKWIVDDIYLLSCFTKIKIGARKEFGVYLK